MTAAHLSDSHRWIGRKLNLSGQTMFHRQCIACRRDFVMSAGTGGWRAVHVGLFGFDFLDEETTHQWTLGECPGEELSDEINDRRGQRDVSLAR
jgi:hypothetical protein